MDIDRIETYTPIKMRYKIDRDLADKDDTKTIISHRGEKKTIETSQVEFHIDEIDLIKMFLEIVGNTAGITEVYMGDISLTEAYEYMKTKRK